MIPFYLRSDFLGEQGMIHWLSSLQLGTMPPTDYFGAGFVMDRERGKIVWSVFIRDHLYLGGHPGLNDDLIFRARSTARHGGLTDADLLPHRESPTYGVYHWPAYVALVNSERSEGRVMRIAEARRLLGNIPEVHKVIIPESHQLAHWET